MRNTFTAVLCFVALFFIPVFAQGQGQPAPNFQVMDTNGEMIDLYDDYLNQGKTVLLELFWDGCPPCNAFAPFLGDLYKDWGEGNGDVEFIALDILLNENNADVIAFQTRHNHTWPGVSANGGSVGAADPYTDGTYGQYLGTPVTVIISPDRTVQYNVNGFNRNQTGIDQLDAALRATGAKKPTDDVSGPVFALEPSFIADINCNDPLPTQQVVTATDSCGVVIISSVDAYAVNNCSGYEITYRWTAADTCGNITDFTRTFNVLPDAQIPVFDKDPTPIPNVTCGDPNPEPEILTATSACGSATVTFSIDDYTPDVCNGNTVTYRWTATSACGFTAEKTMDFIITHDRNPPVFNNEPDSIPDIRCFQVKPLPQTLTASTGCSDATVAFTVDEYEEDLCNGYPITYRWVATDACGSSTVRTRTFQVLPDDSDIIFSAEPASLTDIQCGATFPTAQTITASARCDGDIPVAFSIERSSNEPCGRTITYRWVATDPCGNEIVKTTSFDVEAEASVTTRTVSGGVVNPKNQGVEDVTLFFSGGTSTSVTTNANGQFAVPNLPVNASYTVRPEKNGDIDEGVTTFDLVLITKHILGETPFTEDAQFIAADPNLSNSVTTFDIVLIRKVILGIDNSFQAGSWRFVPEQMILSSLENVNELSFTGIKIGDITGATSFTQTSSEVRNSMQPISLVAKDQSFAKGEVVETVLSLPIDDPLLGFQFTLDFSPDQLQLVNVDNAGLSNFDPTHFNRQQDGKLAISWFDINQAASGNILKLTFIAKGNGRLSEAIQLSSSLTKAEAYTPTEKVAPINLQFLPSNQESGVQIYPNPVSDNFTIQTYVEQSTDLLIEILRLDGSIIQQQQYTAQEAGLQTINVRLTSATSGMYLIKISDRDGVRDIVKLIQE